MEVLGRLVGYFFKPKYIFLMAAVLYGLLLFKDPFSERTLVSNMDPFPDTIHYLTPARSLAGGGNFALVRKFGQLKPVTAPLYSLVLVPFYMINDDARMYYFANVLLSLCSLFLFYKIIRKQINNLWILGFSLVLFSTNYFLYWSSMWAMAENLLILLFLAGVYLFLLKPTKVNILLTSFVIAAIYATKYAYAPISIFFAFFYFLKLVFWKRNKLFNLTWFVSWGLIFSLAIFSYGYFVQGINLFGNLFGKFLPSLSSQTAVTGTQAGWFSITFFSRNFPLYLNIISGRIMRFLWEFSPFYPVWVFYLGTAGLVWGLIKKQTRAFSLLLITLGVSQTLFISTFYAADARYVYHIIPIMLIGVSLFFIGCYNILPENKKFLFYILVIVFGGIYIFGSAMRIKYQIVLNLRYAETPWNYISIKKLNNYFSQKTEDKPMVITSLPPYYVDYFANGNYDVLPLSIEQDFRNFRNLVWGPGDYSNFVSLYKDKLIFGKKLYLATYGIGNEAYLHEAVDDIMRNFKTKEVLNDCYNLCKLYEVTLK